jgi:hypothetical protein
VTEITVEVFDILTLFSLGTIPVTQPNRLLDLELKDELLVTNRKLNCTLGGTYA